MKIDIAVCGMEGTGKTTTVKLLESLLMEAGYSPRRVPFMQLPFNHFTSPHRWMARSAKRAVAFKEGTEMSQYDDNLRALLNVKPSHLSILYVVVFVFRVLAFRVFFAFRSHKRAVIFARYFYDNIAHKTVRSRRQRILESLMLAMTPKPKMLFFLNAPADTIVVRRPRISRENVLTLLARYKALGDRLDEVVTLDTTRGVVLLESDLRDHLRRYLCQYDGCQV